MNRINQKQRRKIRVRSKIEGTKEKPRLSVFRSSRYLYGQIIDDDKAMTIVGVSEKELDLEKEKKVSKIELAKQLGMIIAKKAKEKKIKSIHFDRGRYRYHGRVKAFAEGAREGGLKF